MQDENFGRCGWALLALLAAGSTGPALSKPLDTVAGPLAIVEGHDHPEGGLTIRLGGRTILHDPNMWLASVAKAFPESGPARIVVLSLGTGGNGCPMMLRVIDLGRRPPFVSREFGTCYDEVEVGRTKGGTVRIAQPNPGGRGLSRWTYRDGILSGP